MIAVAVLALAGTAALKLALMAENTLAAVSDKEKLIDRVQEIKVGIQTQELSENNTQPDEEGFSWETKECTQEILGKDFGKLKLGEQTSEDVGSQLKWRELTVTDKKGRKLTVCMPAKDNIDGRQTEETDDMVQNSSESAASDDKK